MSVSYLIMHDTTQVVFFTKLYIFQIILLKIFWKYSHLEFDFVEIEFQAQLDFTKFKFKSTFVNVALLISPINIF